MTLDTSKIKVTDKDVFCNQVVILEFMAGKEKQALAMSKEKPSVIKKKLRRSELYRIQDGEVEDECIPEGLSQSYSVFDIDDDYVEIHIRRMPDVSILSNKELSMF